jgi:hypothetical protein
MDRWYVVVRSGCPPQTQTQTLTLITLIILEEQTSGFRIRTPEPLISPHTCDDGLTNDQAFPAVQAMKLEHST